MDEAADLISFCFRMKVPPPTVSKIMKAEVDSGVEGVVFVEAVVEIAEDLEVVLGVVEVEIGVVIEVAVEVLEAEEVEGVEAVLTAEDLGVEMMKVVGMAGMVLENRGVVMGEGGGEAEAEVLEADREISITESLSGLKLQRKIKRLLSTNVKKNN